MRLVDSHGIRTTLETHQELLRATRNSSLRAKIGAKHYGWMVGTCAFGGWSRESQEVPGSPRRWKEAAGGRARAMEFIEFLYFIDFLYCIIV